LKSFFNFSSWLAWPPFLLNSVLVTVNQGGNKTMDSFSVSTRSRSQMMDITSEVSRKVADSGISDGVCVVFVSHTTAGITINENADPDVTADILNTLDSEIPWNNNYRHSEGNSAAHIKASLMGSSVSVIIDSGKLALGTWQGIYFCEFDGPRTRKVFVQVLEG
jgi:secondary thiamine-phosphate synthase enzyme